MRVSVVADQVGGFEGSRAGEPSVRPRDRDRDLLGITTGELASSCEGEQRAATRRSPLGFGVDLRKKALRQGDHDFGHT